MSEITPNPVRAFAAAPVERSGDPVDLRLLEGLRRLFSRRHRLLALVWTAAMALIGASIAYGLHAFSAPAAVAAAMTIGPSWKLLAAIGIYCGVVLYGSFYLLRGVARVDREFELIDQAEHLAGDLRHSDEARSERFLDRHAPFFYSGSGRLEDIETTAAFELNEILRRNAIERRFDPVSVAVDRVAEKVLGGSFGLRDAQQLGVRLGILFTFIGIVLSLSGVDTIMGGQTLKDAQIREAIRGIVGSLGLAFVSSIAGLLASILLQVLASSLRVKELALIERLQKIGTTIQGIYLRAIDTSDRDRLAERLEEHRTEIGSLSHEIARRGEAIANGMQDMAGLVERPLAALQRQSEMLTTAIAGQEAALAAVSALATRMVGLQADIATAQEKGAEGFARAVATLTERLVAEVHSGFGVTARQDIARHIDDAGARHDRAMRDMTFLYGVGLMVVAVAIGVAVVALVVTTGWRGAAMGP